ncbi:DUF397 domain-containing protein [Streptomyces coffeae]|uniref:DUF397 domain-containing protein n=1 Tax=Streptomyces coffeae TaxID=621382 RepID=A0ABS1NQ80_9ACTN|nr:DUF397 domain-containing protein [Streptomyces coffeae]MBL1102260.1 DUF397 domain-containing protein [Streptomyces coffeae]
METFVFRKSSRSDPFEECVEVATNHPHTVAVRDSKNPRGPVLRFSPAAWVAFRAALTEARVDPPARPPRSRRGAGRSPAR